MKKLLLLLVCFVGIAAQAKKVTEQEAFQKAHQFMEGMQIKHSNMRRAPQKDSANAAYYVFNVEDNSGFVIVSGDDRVPDILGYSDHGNLDIETAPCNLKWWLSYYCHVINSLDEKAAAQTRNIRRTPSDPKAEIAPMLTTTWGQNWPYYNQCPSLEGQQCVTGCVATAMAQVINYHRWPEEQTGEIVSYTTTTNNIFLDKLDPTSFPWENMTDDDIARLMRYCGQAVGMDYGIGESSAYDVRIPGALIGKFGYDNGTRIVYCNGYNSTTWEDLMYNELKAGRPVIYGGQSGSGGHSFILHGYKDGRFYINWGWDGWYDGYFELSLLNPMGDNYGKDQTAVIGIQKSIGGSIAETPKVTVTKLELMSDEVVTRPSASDNFAVSLSCQLQHSFGETTTAQTGYAICQGSEHLQVVGTESAEFVPGQAVTKESTIRFGASMLDGTYRIAPVYRENESSGWIADEGTNYRYIEATISNNALTVNKMPDAAHDERLVYEIIDDNHVSVAPANTSIEGNIVIPPMVIMDDKEYFVSEFAFRGFEGCRFITSISLPATMNMNQYGVFSGCESLNSINVEPNNSLLYSEDGVLFFRHPSYEDGVILYCYPAGKKGERYEVPSTVIDIGDWSFIGNNHLKLVSLSSAVYLIGQYAFANCTSLESINFPEGLTTISYNAFQGCSSLNEIVLPQSLFTLCGNAFADCISLMTVTSKHVTPLAISADTFSPETYEKASLVIPKGRLLYYQSANGWNQFSNMIETEFEDVIVSDDPFDNLNEKQMILGFYADNNEGKPFGGKRSGVYKAAIKFEKSRISPFIGNQITHVRFALADVNISDLKLWISSSLNGEYLYSQAIDDVKEGWNTIKLEVPFDITSDSICIGYEFYQSNGGYPIFATWGQDVENNAEGAGYIYGPYQVDGSSSWDYIYFMNDSRAAVCLQAIVEGESLPAYDMRPVEFNGLRQCYGENRVEGWGWANVKNCGKQAISEAVIGFQIDEETPSFYHYTKGLSSQAFDEGGMIQFTFGNEIKTGKHQAKVFISEINGIKPLYTQDDTLSLSFVVVGDTIPKQKYLYEHYTATWCPYSANSLYETLDAAIEKRDDISLVRIHIDDELSCDACTELGVLQRFIPAYSIDRGAYVGATYVAGAQGLFSDFPENEYVKHIPAVADINIEAAYSQNGTVTIRVSGSRTSDYKLVAEKACLSVMLTEDRLQSAQASGDGYIEGFCNNNVLRACVSDIWGDVLDWDGDKFEKIYNVRFDNSWKRENMHVVAFLANPFTGHNYDDLHVINCNDFDLRDAELMESPITPGDVTGSGTVDVQDATIVVNYILGTENSDDYDYDAADMNGDGEVDVFDVTAIINVIMSGNSNPAFTRSITRQHEALETVSLTAEGNDLLLDINNANRFTSFQFDVEVPQGVDLFGVEWNDATDHLLQFAQTGTNRYTVVALSMNSQPLPVMSDGLLKLRLSGTGNGDVVISNILFVTPQGEAARFGNSSLNIETGIHGVTYTRGEQIFDLSGRRLNMKRGQLGKGIYMIDNKKVVIQ